MDLVDDLYRVVKSNRYIADLEKKKKRSLKNFENQLKDLLNKSAKAGTVTAKFEGGEVITEVIGFEFDFTKPFVETIVHLKSHSGEDTTKIGEMVFEKHHRSKKLFDEVVRVCDLIIKG